MSSEKPLRLIERMRSLPLLHEQYQPSWANVGMRMDDVLVRSKAEAEMAAGFPVIIADEIAEMYAASPQEEWRIVGNEDEPSAFPCIAPPFPVFTIEWNNPLRVLIKGEWLEEPAGQAGMVCIPFKAPEEGSKNEYISFLKNVAGGPNMRDSWSPELERRFDNMVNRSKWVMVMSYWVALFQPPCLGRPAWTGAFSVVGVDSQGSPVHWFQAGPGTFSVRKGVIEPNPAVLFSPTHIALLTLSFMHCKNVVVTKGEAVTDHRWLRRKRLPEIQYKVLELKPMRTILRSEGRMDQEGLKKALHICRGHFRTYGEDSPGLFGKLHGRFWIPQHARGSENLGKVVKHYKVKGP